MVFRRIIKIGLVLIVIGLLVWAALMGMVWWKETHVQPMDQYDAIIVLGAQVKADGTLSVQLTWRLDSAVEAWKKNPCRIVVCGAQGSNEPMPEAYAMRDYLIGKGIPEEDILCDAESVNTKQNIRNAVKMLGEAKNVLIVTSDYHLPRALALAEDEHLSAGGLGSPCKAEYWLKNHARQAISWVKYYLLKILGK